MGTKKILFVFVLFWTSSLSLSAQVLVSVNNTINQDYGELIACKYDDFVPVYSFENEYIKDCDFLQEAKAQQYQSIFGNEATQWIIPRYDVALDHGQGEWKTMDTISVVRTEDEYKILEYQSQMYGGGIYGKIRANETNSKLYLINHRFTTEVLIMDLGLELGDEFSLIVRLLNRDYEHKMIVDSVFVLDGRKHIRFDDPINNQFSSGTKRMFIEGIGPNWGFDYYDLVVCKYDDFVPVYSFENEYIKDCDFITTYIDNNVENNIKIYPNLVLEYVIISIPEMLSMSTELTVYDTAGIRVLNKMLSNSETVLNLSHLPSNVYYFKFQIPNTTIVKKIVKQ